MQRIIFIILLSIISFSTQAETNTAVIKKNLATNFPQLKIDTIEKSPIPGWYQVTSGPIVVYSSADGRYVIDGEILDLQHDQLNLTEQVRKAYRLRVMDKIDPTKMITYKAENKKHVLTVFTDIDCAYCRKFHREINRLTSHGVEVRYMAFPRGGINSPSYKKFVSAWCDPDQQQAMTKAKQGIDLATKNCANPVADQFKTGVEMGVNATPTLLFEDGSLQPGYLPPGVLLEQIATGSHH